MFSRESASFVLFLVGIGLGGCASEAATSPLPSTDLSGGQTGDVDTHSCSLEYSKLKQERFALDAKTPLGVGNEVIRSWTLKGSAEATRFDAATSSHVPSGTLRFDVQPLEVLYASGKAPHEVCKLHEVLSIWSHVVVDIDGTVYENDGRVEVRPAGTISGSKETTSASGELALLELSCTSGCTAGNTLLFAANLDDTGRTIGSITRGSEELSFKVP